MVNRWFVVSIICLVGAIILSYEYEFITQDMPFEEPMGMKQNFDFTAFMLFIFTIVFFIVGVFDSVISRRGSK